MDGDSHAQRAARDRSNPWVLAQQTLELASSFGCLPSPKVYEVFFAYASGNAKVREQIDKSAGQEHLVTSFDLDQIHHENFRTNAGEWERQQRASHAIEKTIDTAVSGIADHLEAGEVYERQLEAATGRLKETKSPDDVSQVIDGLLADTDSVKSATAHMFNSLTSTRDRVGAVTSEIAASRRGSGKDLLTGLIGRNSFDIQLEADINAALKHGVQAMLCIVALDQFDRINEHHGRNAGDIVIRSVGRMMDRFAEGSDVAARLSGAKFGLLMQACSAREALTTAEAIRKELTTREYKTEDPLGAVGPVAVSIGLSVLATGDTVPDLMRRAENCLGKARAQGGNSLVSEVKEVF